MDCTYEVNEVDCTFIPLINTSEPAPPVKLRGSIVAETVKVDNEKKDEKS